jgi:hypothetical protein
MQLFDGWLGWVADSRLIFEKPSPSLSYRRSEPNPRNAAMINGFASGHALLTEFNFLYNGKKWIVSKGFTDYMDY